MDQRLARARWLDEGVPARRDLPRAGRRSRGRGRRRGGGPRSPRPSPHRARRRSSAIGCRRSPDSETRRRREARSPRRRRGRRRRSVASSRPRRRRGAAVPLLQKLTEPSDVLVRRRRLRDLDRRRVLDRSRLREHVLGEREHDRPRPARQRHRECLVQVLGHPIRAVDLPGRLRDAAEDALVVQLLPRLPSADRPRHLSDEQEHRRRVLPRGVDADRGLRRTRASRDEADTGPAGELSVRLRCIRRALLVAGRD